LISNIAYNLRVERAKQRLSQENLSELTGINQQQISYIENGKVCPKLESIVKISEALKITANDLIYRV